MCCVGGKGSLDMSVLDVDTKIAKREMGTKRNKSKQKVRFTEQTTQAGKECAQWL